jgi:hypothetical protein
MSTARDREITQVDYIGKGDLPDVLLSLRVAVYFLMRDRQHNCLLHLQMNQEPKSLELASCVPDYTIHDPISHFILADTERRTTYSAGADNSAWACVSRTPLALAVNPELSSVTPRFEIDLRGVTLILPRLIVYIVSISHQTPTVAIYQDGDLEKTEGFELDENERTKSHRRKLTITACKEWAQLALEP